MENLAAVLAGATTVSYRGCQSPTITTPPTPPTIPPTKPGHPGASPRPWEALARCQFGSAGCTLTIIGPQRADGRWDALTASHCVTGIGQTGRVWLKDGRVVPITVSALDRKADYCWVTVETVADDIPYALLADALPVAGDKVYHGGFGVHIPGDRVSGTVSVPDNGSGQTQYRIEVSSGDSGGGIALTESGRILSPVCCTTKPGGIGDVWGATVTACRQGRPGRTIAAEQWTPIDIPVRMPE